MDGWREGGRASESMIRDRNRGEGWGKGAGGGGGGESGERRGIPLTTAMAMDMVLESWAISYRIILVIVIVTAV